MFKRTLNIVLTIGVWCAIIAYLVVAKTHSQSVISTITIDSLDVAFTDDPTLNFVDAQDIDNWLAESGLTYRNAPLPKVNTALVQQHLQEHIMLKDALCHTTMDGVLHIRVSQHRPVARIIGSNGDDFYLSEECGLLPLLPEHTLYLPLVTINDKLFDLPDTPDPDTPNYFYGDYEKVQAKLEDSLLVIQRNIDELLAQNKSSQTDKVNKLKEKQKILTKTVEKYFLYFHKLLNFVMFVEGDPFWLAQILQINLSIPEGCSEPIVEIVPRAGKHIVCLGTLDQAEEGLNKLRLFYREALAWEGWDGYSYIDLRYNDQIVCRK